MNVEKLHQMLMEKQPTLKEIAELNAKHLNFRTDIGADEHLLAEDLLKRYQNNQQGTYADWLSCVNDIEFLSTVLDDATD